MWLNLDFAFECENLSQMPPKFFVLQLHICVFDSVRVFSPVAFRELVFCFVSNQLELASLIAYDCKFETNRSSTIMSKKRKLQRFGGKT